MVIMYPQVETEDEAMQAAINEIDNYTWFNREQKDALISKIKVYTTVGKYGPNFKATFPKK